MSTSMLPPNVTPNEIAAEAAMARIGDVPVPIRTLWNADTCPAALLPWLAWALSFEPWDEDWPEVRQREVIKAARPAHRIKGTPGAVRAVLASAGFGTVTILERLHRWICNDSTACNGTYYLGDPTKWPLYRIQLNKPITNKQATLVRAMLDDADRAVSKLDSLDFTATLWSCNGSVLCDGNYNMGVA